MFGRLFGRREGNGGGSAPYHRPYRGEAPNHIYNLLFCDNPALLRHAEDGGVWRAVLSDSTDREALARIGNDLDEESRVRALAFNRLRALKLSVPLKRLLGTIIEYPQPEGLDTLAIFPDGRLRYINHSGKMAFFEGAPPALATKAEELLRASQFVVNRYGPWDKPRRAPPKGEIIRMSFLVSDGLYFGEGKLADLLRDRHAAPVMHAAITMVPVLVEEALKIDREMQEGGEIVR